MQSVLTTPTFDRQAGKAGLTDGELAEIMTFLAHNPQSGALMAGTGGARKLRFPGNEGGKSGGYRTIHYFGGDDVPIFLLALVDKGERADLTKEQKNNLAKILPKIADAYRVGVARRVAEIEEDG